MKRGDGKSIRMSRREFVVSVFSSEMSDGEDILGQLHNSRFAVDRKREEVVIEPLGASENDKCSITGRFRV